MKAIKDIVEILSEEESLTFINLLKTKNRRGDTKNIQLYSHIKNGNTKNLSQKLYKTPNRNAYHALCKRLQDTLIDFVASNSFAGETSSALDILKLLLAARIFFEHKKYKIGFKTLNKAEISAVEIDNYAILNEIYHTKIQYAHLNPTIELSEVIIATNRNVELFKKEQQLNIAYATIKQKLKDPSEKSINQIIVETFVFFDIAIDETLSYKSLFQLMNITATSAKLQSDYFTISNFMMETYEVVFKKEGSADKHLYYHLQILHLMAVTSFRNKDFETSKKFTERLGEEITKGYAKRFSEKVMLLKALNANYTSNSTEAIIILKNHKEESLDASLTLTMCYFQQQEYFEAYQIIKNLYHSDTYYEKKMGWIWVLKKRIIEILVLIELDRLELVLSRLSSFNRKFNPKLKEIGEYRVLQFMKFVGQYYEDPKLVTTSSFKDMIEISFEWIGKEQEDIFVMSFYAWLKAKMEERNLYEVTLELVHKK